LSYDPATTEIYTKDMLMAPLAPGMERPPHPMRLGDEQDYYVRGPELLRDPDFRKSRPDPAPAVDRPHGGAA
jgi:NADH-quinone oxidoreductase subunit I